MRGELGLDRDRITAPILLGAPRSEHSAQAEMLDMQEVTGSSPVSPTKYPIHARSDRITASGCRRPASGGRCSMPIRSPPSPLHGPSTEVI
jgi:hypothetical protein